MIMTIMMMMVTRPCHTMLKLILITNNHQRCDGTSDCPLTETSSGGEDDYDDNDDDDYKAMPCHAKIDTYHHQS